ncbi:unnamed protein product [Spirodela intermedia]|uniref:non-specific serine/threonine protein kinase n=1 Tax=Spirodela intermedia TaxID=51605 RepID=A0A7I8KEV5_SPIIN|nr:unnamed protein product [Spirodela intermedia]
MGLRIPAPFLFLLLVPILSADSATDREALLSFKGLISDDPLGAMDAWNESTPLCRWRGVTCGGGTAERVTELALNGLRLAGQISPRLSRLAFLTKLDLSANRLDGAIPGDLGRLAALQRVNLSINSLIGEIPSTLGNCSGLQYMSLRDNKLRGRIPGSISNCANLEILSFSGNNLDGEIPPELGSLPKLQYLGLSFNNLRGPIPSSLANISTLTTLELISNSKLGGKIPPELGSLPKLQFLRLSSNNLFGSIPSSLGNISTLSSLDLSNNSLRGSIPPELGNLSNLTALSLFTNELTGAILPRMGNLSKMTQLYLNENLLEGEIPGELGGMKNLNILDVFQNKLSGRIPPSVWNLSSLILLHVGYNQLSGPLPGGLGETLPNLKNLHLFGNQFIGTLPPSVSNATGMEVLEVAENRLGGVIPPDLGKLQNLRLLDFSGNKFQALDEEDWSFLTSLTNCRSLEKLELQNNSLGGVLPPAIVNLSRKLNTLRIDRNQIGGMIPEGLGNLVGLSMLYMGGNLLAGGIPVSIGELTNLEGLKLEENMLSGEIPPSLGGLSNLSELSLGGNLLEGRIPTAFGGLRNLEALNLSDNNLHGEIPREILSLTSLSRHLDLSGNRLIGSLPLEIGKLKNLKTLDLSRNGLSGEIPSSIGGCQVLEFLLLESNLFQGAIPWALSNLKGIQELDLSGNRLSGKVPEFLEGLSLLRRLNLSNNSLEGEVPRGGIFENANAVSLVGNNGLCGRNPGLLLLPCQRRRNSVAIKVAVPLGVILFVVLLAASLFAYRSKKKSLGEKPPPSHLGKISYEEFHRSTGGFSPDNIVGRGAHGCVYRGKLGKRSMPVAVKVLEPGSAGAAKSFMAEFEALRNVRHRNLVKILASFSGADFQGNEFKALVYELVPNGCLDQWIHPEDFDGPRPTRSLGLVQRLSIAVDVAHAIEYLHQCIDSPIIHSDLKPSNILLDDGMTARVSDFGLARFLTSGSSHCTIGSVGLKGTIGYVAPELATLGRVSTATDVYSFGILLLEIFTGKRPTDPIFVEGLSLHRFVREALPHQVMAVADPQLLPGEGEEEDGDGGAVVNLRRNPMIECLISVLKLGLLCSEESQRDRPRIRDVVKSLTLTRDAFLRSESRLGYHARRVEIEIDR